MRALLDDAAVVEHDQPVHARDGREPVRDRDHGLACHQRAEALLDRGLDLAVERRGRLVEHQDRRVLQDHARDRDALALAARELDAALADLRVVAAPALPVLELEDELVRLRAPRRVLDLGVGRVGPAVADVVADRAVQQRGVLRHHRDLRAQALLRDARDVLPVDQDAAALEVEEAQQQVDQRRLAGAGAADQPDLLARLHGQGQAVDDGERARQSVARSCLAAVAEAHVLEADLAARHVERRRAGASVSAIGRAIVIMPSCTTPMFSKIAVIC